MISLEAARDEHEAATQRHKTAEEERAGLTGRLQAAVAEVSELTGRIVKTDPDDAGALSSLVSARTLAQGKAEALRARVDAAMAALAEAARALAAARDSVHVAEITDLDARHRELAAQLDREAYTAQARMASIALELRAVVSKAHALALKDRPACQWSSPVDQWAPLRGNPWARSSPGAEIDTAAARIQFLTAHPGSNRLCPICGRFDLADKGVGPFQCIHCGYSAC